MIGNNGGQHATATFVVIISKYATIQLLYGFRVWMA
jgi:hypothetical protein